MIPFLGRRILGSITTLALVAALVFFSLRLAPGGPFDEERAVPPEITRAIEAQYGLDQPMPVQFGRWIWGAIQGDFGPSFRQLETPVSEIIGHSLSASVWLGLLALAVSVLIGIPLGSLAAFKQNTWWDSSAMFFAVSGVSLPIYLIASVLIIVFSLGLGWLPPALWEGPLSMVLPVVTLAIRPIALIARLTRASMIEALCSDYIRTAHSKGVPESRVIFKHALRNSLIPVITLLGPITASLVTGSFVVEVVFNIPGIGKYFVSGVIDRDYNLVMGITLTYGAILLIANLLVETAYGIVDPRIRITT